jgi:hypothetical protein
MRELTRRQLSRKAARLRAAQEAYYYRHRPIRDIAAELGVTVETVAAYLREPLTPNAGGPIHESTPDPLQRLWRRDAVVAATSSNSISTDEQSRRAAVMFSGERDAWRGRQSSDCSRAKDKVTECCL